MEILFSGMSNENILYFELENNKCINLLYIYNNNINLDTLQLLDKFTFNSSYDLLYISFINLEYINVDFNEIIKLYVKLFRIFNNYPNKRIENQPIINKNIETNYKNIDNKLIIRTGIIELRACYITNNEHLRKSMSDITSNIDDHNYLNKIANNHQCWISVEHDPINYSTYIVKLMMQAGFHVDSNLDEAIEAFLFFKNGYINAIRNCDYLTFWSFLNCYSLNILNDIKKTKNINHVNYPNDKDLCDIFDNKNILFLTAFKDLIDKQIKTKNIYKLRKNYNLTNIKLTTIEAFLTTYPNKKGKNFIETYNYYIAKIDEMFLLNKYDIFTCSCGCYGILLCNYVYNKYKITSFYMGNYINVFFGIAFKKLDNTYYNEEFFFKSDLNSRYLNLENIENNLYGYTK